MTYKAARLSSITSGRWQMTQRLAFALVAVVTTSPLNAAEFRAITPEMIAGASPYHWFDPVISVTAISGDGSTIAGTIQDTGVIYGCVRNMCGVGPFVWSLDDASIRSHIINPTPLNYETYVSEAAPVFATALSHNGQDALVVSEWRHFEAAIYRDGEPQLLRPRIVSDDPMWATDMSSDGSAVVGNLGPKPFRWTESGGLREIDGLPANTPFTATAVSGDGRVVLLDAQPGFTHGASWLGVDTPRGNGYTWTETEGLAELSQLTGDDYSHAAATSHDGDVVVGTSVLVTPDRSHVGRAVRWNGGVLTELDSIAQFSWSATYDVSANGTFAVGRVYNHLEGSPPTTIDQLPADFLDQEREPNSRAVLWNDEGNVIDLQELLVSELGLGKQLEGWTLTSASHISDDGRVIAGRGVDSDGNGAVWVANLAVPEPSAFALMFGGAEMLLFFLGRRRLKRA